MDQVDLMDQMDKMGASCYTPRVCCAVVWYGSGKELPLGKATRPAAVLVRASPGQSGIFKGQRPLNDCSNVAIATRFFLLSFFFIRKKSVVVFGGSV